MTTLGISSLRLIRAHVADIKNAAWFPVTVAFLNTELPYDIQKQYKFGRWNENMRLHCSRIKIGKLQPLAISMPGIQAFVA